MNKVLLILLILVAAISGSIPAAVAQPLPVPDPGSPDPNLFYGATPPNGQAAPVIVFIPGLKGTASDWWLNGNTMYSDAYGAGFRTAFISLSVNNSPNDASIVTNSQVLKNLLPKVAQRMNATQMYVVCHSKGGLDLQAAMLLVNAGVATLDPAVAPLIKAVFMLGTPNLGTALADWAFSTPGGASLASTFGLLGPGTYALRTSGVATLRALADPVFTNAGIPFFTMGGTQFIGNVITLVTGVILNSLVPNTPNDGLVPLPSTLLPSSYSTDIGQVPNQHFGLLRGNVSWARIWSQIQGIENAVPGFRKIATGGFGDPSNTWIWSLKWFKGRLYAGTGREVGCLSFATNAYQTGQPNSYPPPTANCPQDPRNLSLAAEIWAYTPETRVWTRVYRSPMTIQLGTNAQGTPMMSALDVAYRGMTIFREANGVDALYVATVTSSSAFEGYYSCPSNCFPPPRILRTVDGVNWAPIPQNPGTVLGDIYKNSPQQYKIRGFRELTVFNGQLIATATDYIGVGRILASSNPALGDDSFQFVSPAAATLPIRSLKVFNNQLYVSTGDRRLGGGYGLYRTSGGAVPFNYTPVVTNGAFQTNPAYVSPDALSLEEFNGQLYVGTDRPTEMIRVNPDDSWQLLVGEPRQAPNGAPIRPATGLGLGFGNGFTGHFYRMNVYNNELYLGTWDWSSDLAGTPVLDPLFASQFGFDLYKTRDGVNWSYVNQNGMNDFANWGCRTFETTGFGMFLGTTRQTGGAQVWWNGQVLDLNGDGNINQLDVNTIMGALNQPANGPNDPRDVDRDGRITANDARKLITQCDRPGCAVTPAQPVRPSAPLVTSSSQSGIQLSWTPVPGAVRYHVFRSAIQQPLAFLPPNGINLTLDGVAFNLPNDVLNGSLDQYCVPAVQKQSLCTAVNLVKLMASNPGSGLPEPYGDIFQTSATAFSEPPATNLQSRYFVKAEDAAGRLSNPSNLVGAPLK